MYANQQSADIRENIRIYTHCVLMDALHCNRNSAANGSIRMAGRWPHGRTVHSKIVAKQPNDGRNGRNGRNFRYDYITNTTGTSSSQNHPSNVCVYTHEFQKSCVAYSTHFFLVFTQLKSLKVLSSDHYTDMMTPEI